MGIFIDCLIIAVMVLCIFIGYKKGLIKVAIGFVAIIASIIIAIILYKPVANIIIKYTQLDDKISDGIYENIKEIDFNNIKEEEMFLNYDILYLRNHLKINMNFLLYFPLF